MISIRKKGKSKESKQIKAMEYFSAEILEKPWYASYSFLAPRIGPIVRRFKGLRSAFIKANLIVDFDAYVSFLLFGTILAFVITFGLIASMDMFILKTRISIFMGIHFPFMVLPLLISALAGGIAFSSIYIYPSYEVINKKAKIEGSLLYAVSYMYILAKSGMSPERIFRYLAVKPEIQGVYEQARLIVRDIDMFGVDFISAVNTAIQRSPSKPFAEVLEGFVSLIYSGGNLSEYLMVRTDELIKKQASIVKAFIEKLGMLSEAAVAVIAVFPLIFIVSYSVSSLLPAGMFAQPLFVYAMVYIIIPFMSIVFLAILRTDTSKT